MDGSRGRRVAGGAAVVGVLVVAGAGFAMKDRAIEEWNIWRLGSGSFPARFRAARRLGEMGSIRAVPGLIALLRECHGRNAEAAEVWGPGAIATSSVASLLGQIGPPAVPALVEALEETAGERGLYWRRDACRALAASGSEEAVPALAGLVDDEGPCLRLIVMRELGSMGPSAEPALPALRVAAQKGKGTISRAAAEAVRKIEPEGSETPR